MTFDEKEKKILQNRGTSLLGYSGALQSEADLQAERDLNNSFLFGDGTNIGVVNVLEMFIKELNISIGRTTSAPAMQGGIGSSVSAWKSQFSAAASSGGDGEFYLDVDPADGIGDEDINTGTVWIQNNGYDPSQTETKLKDDIQAVIDAIGTAADTSTQRDTVDYGTGLLGQRTADNTEVQVAGTDPVTGDPIQETKYGDGTTDNPDYFNEPERGSFLNALDTLITNTTSYINYMTNTISAELGDIANNTNTLFETPDMDADLGASSLKSQVDARISSITTIKNNLATEYSYFSGFTASDDISGQTGYVRSTFDTRYQTTVPGYMTNLANEIDGRTTEVEAALSLNSTSGIRTWLVFWVKENINKPQSPYIGLNGISNAKSQAVAGISKANESLITLFGENRSVWVAQPNNAYAFQSNVFNADTGELIERRNSFGWIGAVYANKADIYRKEISTTGLIPDNTAWTNDATTDLFTVNTLDPETGIIPQIYEDKSVFSQGEIYVYRVQVHDAADGATRQGVAPLDPSGASSSLQNKIYDDENAFPFTGITNGVFTFTDADDNAEFAADQFIAITSTTSSNGIYRIASIVSKTITLVDTSLNTTDAGSVSKVFGIVSVDT